MNRPAATARLARLTKACAAARLDRSAVASVRFRLAGIRVQQGLSSTAVFSMMWFLGACEVAEAKTSRNASTITWQQGTDAPETLTGEWGGLRTKLRDDGLDLTAGYVSETAANLSGGERKDATETGQFSLGATLDTEKLIGWRGGEFRATITYRRGKDLGAVAGLGVLQQVQEVYGRGQTWRLTQFWYRQALANSHVDLKMGRLTQGEDFAAFSCDLQNLSFCGSPPGNLAGDYWYNWPISQWGARVLVKNKHAYAMIGAYEINPRNLDNDFTMGHFKGAKGALVPAEVGLNPRLGSNRLPGHYRVGVWYNTARGNDIALDVNRNYRSVTGLEPLSRKGRYGFYAQLQQQITGSAKEGDDGPITTDGLTGFLNITQTDRRTTVTDNQIAAGLTYKGPFIGRPNDDVTIAVARTNVNGRSLKGLPPGSDLPDSEYAAELSYCFHRIEWLSVRPNVQYVVNPGGYRNARNIVVLGLKASVSM